MSTLDEQVKTLQEQQNKAREALIEEIVKRVLERLEKPKKAAKNAQD